MYYQPKTERSWKRDFSHEAYKRAEALAKAHRPLKKALRRFKEV